MGRLLGLITALGWHHIPCILVGVGLGFVNSLRFRGKNIMERAAL